MTDADFPNRFEARLHVTFADADTVEIYVDDVYGGARRPPAREAVCKKFRQNAGLTGGEDDVLALENTILAIERKPVAAITQALRRLRPVAVSSHAALQRTP